MIQHGVNAALGPHVAICVGSHAEPLAKQAPMDECPLWPTTPSCVIPSPSHAS